MVIGVDKAQSQERHEKILQTARPILFNTETVRAILDGRKTVTRRAIKPQHLRVPDSPYRKEHPEVPDKVLIEKLCEPPYKQDDYLYVRETWDNEPITPDGNLSHNGVFYYKADGDLRPENWRGNWHPSIHMPKEAARIFLRVTDVRVERLNDMDYMDAIYEGIEPLLEEDGYPAYNPMIDFIDLWDSTIKPKDRDKYGWEANPWVWVVEFEKINLSEVK